MQALQKKQKTWALLLLGALLGLAACLCLYGTAPLDPANDVWIWYGYDETDIHQHYAGWLGFRNSSWQFPLAQADALAYPAGTGVNISFTDSLPWVSVLFKLLGAGRGLEHAGRLPICLLRLYGVQHLLQPLFGRCGAVSIHAGGAG